MSHITPGAPRAPGPCLSPNPSCRAYRYVQMATLLRAATGYDQTETSNLASMHTSSVFPGGTHITFAHLLAIVTLIVALATLRAIRGNCCHRCTPSHQNWTINACATHRQWWWWWWCGSSPRHRCISEPRQMACQACNNYKQVIIDLYSLSLRWGDVSPGCLDIGGCAGGEVRKGTRW